LTGVILRYSFTAVYTQLLNEKVKPKVLVIQEHSTFQVGSDVN